MSDVEIIDRNCKNVLFATILTCEENCLAVGTDALVGPLPCGSYRSI